MREVLLTFKPFNGKSVKPGTMKTAGECRLALYAGDIKGENIRVYAEIEHLKKLYDEIFGDYKLTIYPEKKSPPVVNQIRKTLSERLKPQTPEVIYET